MIKEHRNHKINRSMRLKYNHKYHPDFYMIRLMHRIGQEWKPHRNPRNYAKLKWKFRERMRSKAE